MAHAEATDVATAEAPSTQQRLFMRYFTAILVDLAVLNLFAEYWDRVVLKSFTVSLGAAILLQALLKLTLAVEHRVATYFNAMTGFFARSMRFLSAWAILFGSKFAILGALGFAFGGSLHFVGALHGVGPLIVVLITMLAAEEAIVRFYRSLA